IALNAGILLVLFPVSLFLGPVMSMCAKSFGGIIAGIAHAWAVLNLVICFMILWFMENWKFGVTLLGLTASMFLQRAIFSLLMFLFLTREFGHDGANVAWWTGKWVSAGLGWMAVTQPAREFVCKIVELSLFATDYIAAHLIWFMLAPLALIPFIDKWHSMMLFWLRPSKQIRPPIFSLRQRAQRRRASILYGILFVVTFVFFLAIIVGPLAIGNII
ncbi:glycosyltransferase family 48 protein, partial [Conidiobolus coronatus NRRL 28638]